MFVCVVCVCVCVYVCVWCVHVRVCVCMCMCLILAMCEVIEVASLSHAVHISDIIILYLNYYISFACSYVKDQVNITSQF